MHALEVIVQSVDDAVAAEQGGADRLELVRDLGRDGLTPDLALADAICARVRVPVRVMIREEEPFVASSPAVIERMLAESGPGESRTCQDVFAALVRLVDAQDPSYRD